MVRRSKSRVKQWVQKVTSHLHHPGSFSRKASRSKRSTKQFAKQVLKSPSRQDLTTRRQAQFFVNINRRNRSLRGGLDASGVKVAECSSQANIGLGRKQLTESLPKEAQVCNQPQTLDAKKPTTAADKERARARALLCKACEAGLLNSLDQNDKIDYFGTAFKYIESTKDLPDEQSLNVVSEVAKILDNGIRTSAWIQSREGRPIGPNEIMPQKIRNLPSVEKLVQDFRF